ncbi:hypothetical protein CC1G_01064 [Coprinopsis cinerea okayama7|uniref:Uncharacterized protein n=1 Tax=Coprinopsis cinerea (strain Okayama-7 / 130 / ATCC MYA-4618 / FGSC 9003) TaxID=240176 RepID=A8NEE2_COPC7|nr:hypothetical protein CC1G_01064 [Coprinopsis cinerea okayama7\|eukprot:XP_001833002.2 hypothetical protein CC1G_01064 [Coprinopsis cinerea okayama7\
MPAETDAMVGILRCKPGLRDRSTSEIFGASVLMIAHLALYLHNPFNSELISAIWPLKLDMDADDEAVIALEIEYGPRMPDKLSISTFTTIEQALAAYQLLIPQERAISTEFWTEFSAKWMLWGLKACMAIFLASGGGIVPREFQLRATMAVCSGFDALIDVGTGYGKTFCMPPGSLGAMERSYLPANAFLPEFHGARARLEPAQASWGDRLHTSKFWTLLELESVFQVGPGPQLRVHTQASPPELPPAVQLGPLRIRRFLIAKHAFVYVLKAPQGW